MQDKEVVGINTCTNNLTKITNTISTLTVVNVTMKSVTGLCTLYKITPLYLLSVLNKESYHTHQQVYVLDPLLSR